MNASGFFSEKGLSLIRHVVFYDGECPFCRAVKRVSRRLDWKHRIAWFPVQEVSEGTLKKAEHVVDMYDEIYMLTSEKQVLVGFLAVRKLLNSLPLTRFVSLFLYLPLMKRAGDVLYRYVSRNRYRWFGKVPYER